jgi:hypothetical protein
MITDHSYSRLYFPKVNGQFIHNNNRGALTDDEEHAMYSLHPEDAITNANRKGYFEGVTVFELVFKYRIEYQPQRADDRFWEKMRYFRTLLSGEIGFSNFLRRASFTSLADFVWRLIDINSGEIIRQEIPSEWMARND